jgi:5'-deoxynucleotidase YfbR-like HD superfamily hydrolase
MTDGRKKRKHEDLTGEVFGRWAVVKPVPKNHEKYNKHALYFCRCECGTERIVAAIHLRSGHSKSCDCLRVELVSKKPFESVYNKLLYKAEKDNHTVTLSYEDYLVFTDTETCHYCGAEIYWCKTKVRKKAEGHNLDRKDNSLGYSIENCVVCCGDCNRTKGDRYTYDEFMLLSHGLRLVQYLRHPVPREDMNFMHTFSGKMFRYLDPSPEDVCVEDIAHALSQLNRFVGQTTKPYSVAQHSVLVSHTCPAEFSLYGLLHDASEAYTNDVCRVLKVSPGMGIYKWYENLAMSAVCKKFNLPEKEPPEVKTADLVLLLTEKRDLFKNTCLWAVNKYDGTSHLEPLKKKIRPWTAEEAEEKFLERFSELKTIPN